MQAVVVFSAGLGTRLLPITATCPKPLVPILDVPLIDLAIDKAEEFGARVFVNVSHLGDLIRRHVRDRDVHLLIESPRPYGHAATLRVLGDSLSDTVITYNCDLVSDVDLGLLLEAHRDAGRLATLACVHVTDHADIIPSGRSLQLSTQKSKELPGYRFIGAACFELEGIRRLPEELPLGLVEGLVRPLLEQDAVSLYLHRGYAQDAGTPRGLFRVNADAVNGELSVPTPGRIVQTDGGRAYVGPGASIAKGSLGVDAIIGAGARVHPESNVASSMVWPGEEVPISEIRDCIFFRGSAISALR